jgi:magnesium and cobalt exporter, CNNM family
MAASMSEWGFLIAAIFFCLLGNGFFSGSEIALLSAKRGQIEALIAAGNHRAARVKKLQDDPDTLLATVQIGVTFMGTLAGVLGGYLAKLYVEPVVARSAFGHWIAPTVAATLIVGAGIVYVELVLGELVPKALALRYSTAVAMLASGPVRLMERLSGVLIGLLKGSTRAVLLVFGIREVGRRTFVSEEEIKHMVKEGREQGVLDQTEMELIHSVFEFSETQVKKVMVPRPKIFALDVDTPPEDVERMVVESGFSRIPVYEGSADNIIGVVYIKDALRLLERRQPLVLRKILQPVHFVPENKKVGALLKELQKRRTHLAMVVDEHGSVTGLVTMEDLLEEIVGEIQDEYDWEERPVEKLRDGSLVVEGTTAAAELRDVYHIPIPDSEEFDTVAGFMLNSLGSVPRGGEVVGVGDYRLTVVDVEKNRISKVKIEKSRAPVKV